MFVLSAKFSPDGRRLVTGGSDGTVRVWERGAEMRRIETGWPVNDIGLDADGQIIGVGGEGGAGLWSLESGEPMTPLAGHCAAVWAVRFSRDGSQVAASRRLPVQPAASVTDSTALKGPKPASTDRDGF